MNDETGGGLLDPKRSLLLMIDLQERLAPSIAGYGAIRRRAIALLGGARRLGVPIVFTEQYPKGLGPTDPALLAAAPGAPVLEKIHFDATAEAALPAACESAARDQIVMLGTEAHVCVLQTAFGLAKRGAAPWIVADAVGSRRGADREIALQRLAARGCKIVSAEMVLFEWLGRADTDAFRETLPAIRALADADAEPPAAPT